MLKVAMEALAVVGEQSKRNRRIQRNVDNLLAEAGFAFDASARNQLSCMNFDSPATLVKEPK